MNHGTFALEKESVHPTRSFFSPHSCWRNLVFGMLPGCTPSMTFEQAIIFPEDQLETLNPPAPKNLVFVPETMVLLVLPPQSPLSETHQIFTTQMLRELLTQESRLQVIEPLRLENALQQNNLVLNEDTSLEKLLGIGKFLQSTYVGILSLKPSQKTETIAEWRAELHWQVYHQSSKQLILDKIIEFSTGDFPGIWNRLKPIFHDHFPLKGYVLETRNHREWAKINLGIQQSLQVGQELRIFRRIIRDQQSPDLLWISETFYQPVGKMKLVRVTENAAYGIIFPEGRNEVRKGDVVLGQ